MKLLTKINRSFLLASLAVFLVCSMLSYFLLRDLIYTQQDNDITDEKDQVISFIEQSGKLPVAQAFGEDLLEIRKVKAGEKIPEDLYDKIIYDTVDLEEIPVRLLSFLYTFEKENYIITIGESRLQSDDFTEIVLLFVVLFMIAFFSVLFFINKRVSKKIWSPFNDTLNKLKAFDLSLQNKISFSKSQVTEFDELSVSLNKMTDKIYNDYSTLKQFTENASHEIQTPLSIMRNRLEMLIQGENFTEEQLQSVQKINEAVSRLSKLNTALLTLTKIENHQFVNPEKIELASFVKDKLQSLNEIIEEKNISVSADADETVFITMNPSLAHLLFDNLLGNAIKHNMAKGFIRIVIKPHEFSVSNSGTALQVSPETLFDRFVKNNPSSDSLGLGLAMVKQICTMYGFAINYNSQENIHTISIGF